MVRAAVLHRVLTSVLKPYRLDIDYSRPLTQMIADGRYDFVNSNITADSFSVKPGKTTVEAVIIHTGHNTTTRQVLMLLRQNDLLPANLPQLLAFGAKYPDRQRDYQILALGTDWAVRGGRGVGHLWGNREYRGLDYRYSISPWDGYYRFLAVVK